MKETRWVKTLDFSRLGEAAFYWVTARMWDSLRRSLTGEADTLMRERLQVVQQEWWRSDAGMPWDSGSRSGSV